MNIRQTAKQILENKTTHKNSHSSHELIAKKTKKKNLEGQYVSREKMTNALIKDLLECSYLVLPERNEKVELVPELTLAVGKHKPQEISLKSHYGFLFDSKKYNSDFPKLSLSNLNGLTNPNSKERYKAYKVKSLLNEPLRYEPQVNLNFVHKNSFALLSNDDNQSKEVRVRRNSR